MICPYCQNKAELVTGKSIYPHRHDLDFKMFYVCWPCDARVGCHGKTSQPLGNLANAELRVARGSAHKQFDRIWKDGFLKRKEAYRWLQTQMEMNKHDCHIAKMSIAECKRAEELSSAYLILNQEAARS